MDISPCIQHYFSDFPNFLHSLSKNNSFWNMVGALGQWAGAFATVVAVWIALKSSSLSLSTKLNLSIEPVILRDAIRGLYPAISWEVVNTGIRPVRPVSAGVIIEKTKRQTVFPGYIKFSKMLEQSERIQFLIPMDEFLEGIVESGGTGACNLTFYVSDTHGKRHFKKWKKFNAEKIKNKYV